MQSVRFACLSSGLVVLADPSLSLSLVKQGESCLVVAVALRLVALSQTASTIVQEFEETMAQARVHPPCRASAKVTPHQATEVADTSCPSISPSVPRPIPLSPMAPPRRSSRAPAASAHPPSTLCFTPSLTPLFHALSQPASTATDNTQFQRLPPSKAFPISSAVAKVAEWRLEQTGVHC